MSWKDESINATMQIMTFLSIFSFRKKDELKKDRFTPGVLERWDSWVTLSKSLARCLKIEKDILTSPSHMKLSRSQIKESLKSLEGMAIQSQLMLKVKYILGVQVLVDSLGYPQ